MAASPLDNTAGLSANEVLDRLERKYQALAEASGKTD
jgi:hypothetical protein